MTDKRPLALRLADALDERCVTRWVHATGETPRAAGYAVDAECAQAAAELRRLHSVNAQLLEALEWVARRCPERFIEEVLHPGHREAAYDAGACARAAIAAAKERA